MLKNKQNDTRTNLFLEHLMSLSYNKKCADCGKQNPSWVSLNFGLFICYECSSMHRKLGAQITKVKSVQMDAWSIDELRRMYVGGNKNTHKLDQDMDFVEKYKNTEEFIADLDTLVEKSVKKEPEDSFMNIETTKKSFVSKAVVVKQAKNKFSDVISSSEEADDKPVITKERSKERIKEEPKEESTSEGLSYGPKTSSTLKKTVNSSRSPFSFTVKEIQEEE